MFLVVIAFKTCLDRRLYLLAFVFRFVRVLNLRGTSYQTSCRRWAVPLIYNRSL